jgi:hypothetical protein
MGRVLDLTGRTFGQLTVIEFAGLTAAREARWLCRCTCGNEATAESGNLVNGLTNSCDGCQTLRKEGGRLKRLTIDLPVDVHTRFKIFCASRKTTMVEEVVAAILERLPHD